MNILPKARTENIVLQNLGKETLIYDLNTHKAFNLNETLSIVYQACDGQQTFAALKRKNRLTDDLIYLALDELQSNGLLKTAHVSPFTGMNRRDVIRKIGLTTMTALPVIAGLVAPRAVQASSSCATLCSGRCVDLQNDRTNCGLCGTNCAVGTTCANGSCVIDPNS